jgi:hypothetical protein
MSNTQFEQACGVDGRAQRDLLRAALDRDRAEDIGPGGHPSRADAGQRCANAHGRRNQRYHRSAHPLYQPQVMTRETAIEQLHRRGKRQVTRLPKRLERKRVELRERERLAQLLFALVLRERILVELVNIAQQPRRTG